MRGEEVLPGAYVTYDPPLSLDGAKANALGFEPVDEDEKPDRWDRFMETQRVISEKRMARKVGQTLDILIDAAGKTQATGRSSADAPEIDGQVFITNLGKKRLKAGDLVKVKIERAADYDLWGSLAG